MLIQDIKKATASHFSIEVSDLTGPSRRAIFTRPRQIAMFIARQQTDKSLPDIGRSFGGRDHTTVMYAERCVRDRMDAETRSDIEAIEEKALGGMFRSQRSTGPIFKTTRKSQ